MSETQDNPGQVLKELARIQSELKAPKDQYNSFSKFYYRSVSGIMEGLKAVMQGCAVTLNDEVVRKGERIYIKATATLIAPDGSTASCNAFAREAEEKKGCDSAQVTGATSSYARKYALNGLFAIDDTKDSDSETVGADEEQKATAEQIAEVSERCKTLDVDMDAFCKHIGVEFLADMTTAQYRKAVSSLNRKEKASK